MKKKQPERDQMAAFGLFALYGIASIDTVAWAVRVCVALCDRLLRSVRKKNHLCRVGVSAEV